MQARLRAIAFNNSGETEKVFLNYLMGLGHGVRKFWEKTFTMQREHRTLLQVLV